VNEVGLVAGPRNPGQMSEMAGGLRPTAMAGPTVMAVDAYIGSVSYTVSTVKVLAKYGEIYTVFGDGRLWPAV
jgi:hypothetical protein